MTKTTPAFMIAGTSSGVGKTTVAMGIMAALSKDRAVQPYKVGPDYIDPAFHSYITDRQCRNLDSYMLEDTMIKYLYDKHLDGADVAVVEGVMGLFDGAEVGSDIGTSASIAKMLDIPVILVVSGAKVATSLAATVKGFELFDPELKLAGVIINQVGSDKHYDLLKRAIEYHTNVKVCGYLLKNSKLDLPERHLGLVPAGEQADLDEMFRELGEQVAKTVDMEAVHRIGCEANSEDQGKLEIHPFEPSVFNRTPVRIGIAKDKAFNFYYQDALDYLESYGCVTWIPFSPMQDKSLPENLDGLYFGGGFPEIFPDELKLNQDFIKELLEKLSSGIPYTAECGGLMYLCETLTDLDGIEHPMVGWLPGGTSMTKGLQRFGYAKLSLKEESIFGSQGDAIKIHEFHRSAAEVDLRTAYHIEKSRGGQVIDAWDGGYIRGNGIAAYAHMHFMSNTAFGENFVKACVAYKRGRQI